MPYLILIAVSILACAAAFATGNQHGAERERVKWEEKQYKETEALKKAVTSVVAARVSKTQASAEDRKLIGDEVVKLIEDMPAETVEKIKEVEKIVTVKGETRVVYANCDYDPKVRDALNRIGAPK